MLNLDSLDGRARMSGQVVVGVDQGDLLVCWQVVFLSARAPCFLPPLLNWFQSVGPAETLWSLRFAQDSIHTGKEEEEKEITSNLEHSTK